MWVNRFTKSLWAYALLLIPTVILFWQGGGDSTLWSQLIESGWKWSRVLLGSDAPKWLVVILSDSLLYGAVLWVGWQYFQLLKTPPSERPHSLGRMFWTLTLVGSLILIFVLPFHSRDILGYINRGTEIALYGANPYLMTVDQLPHWHKDPMLHDHWIHNPSPYGFFFTGLTGWMVQLTGAHFLGAWLAFKTLAWLSYVASVFCLYHVGLRLFPERAPWVTVSFGWNPLILLHVVANGHNDLLTGLPLMLALVMAGISDWRKVATFPLWMLSLLTKYTGLVVAPFLLGFALKNRTASLAFWAGLPLALGLLWWTMAPFLPEPPSSFPWTSITENATMSQHSLHSALYRLGHYLIHGLFPEAIAWLPLWKNVLKWVLWGLFFLCIVYRLYGWRSVSAQTSSQRLLEDGTWVMTLLILVCSSKFHPWYLGMLLPLASLLPLHHGLRAAIYGITLGQLLSVTPLENLHIGNFLLLTALPAWFGYRHLKEPEAASPIAVVEKPVPAE